MLQSPVTLLMKQLSLPCVTLNGGSILFCSINDEDEMCFHTFFLFFPTPNPPVVFVSKKFDPSLVRRKDKLQLK